MRICPKSILTFIATACLAAGCGKSEIKTYRVAKEERPPLPAPANAHATGGAPSLPHVHGDTPAGWQELPPERMRVASFQIRADGGRMAQMALIPMPGARDIEVQSINLWREEMGLEPFTQEQYNAEAKAIKVGDGQGSFFEMTSRAPRSGEDFNRATLGAVFEREGMLWFAKLTGEGSLVAEQKESFQKYLRSLEFHAGSHDSPAATPGASTERPVSANSGKIPPGSTLPRWNPPAGWKEKPPGPMVTAAFTAENEAGQADVTISKLAGEGGGMVANVNRWRGQLGLAPGANAEIQKSVSILEIDGRTNAYLADLKGTNARTGKPARMLAAGVPRAGETWFYKLVGDEAVVEKEKDAFVKFITSAY